MPRGRPSSKNIEKFNKILKEADISLPTEQENPIKQKIAKGIVIDRFRVFRADSNNWCYEDTTSNNPENTRLWYPNLESLFICLFREKISSQARNTVEGVVLAIKDAKEQILKALEELKCSG